MRLIAILLLLPTLVFGAEVEIDFAWDANVEPDLYGYNLWVSDFSGGGYGLARAFDVTTSGTATVDMNAGETRYFVLTAINEAGLESGYSNEVSFFLPIPEPHQPPANPGGLRVGAHRVLSAQ